MPELVPKGWWVAYWRDKIEELIRKSIMSGPGSDRMTLPRDSQSKERETLTELLTLRLASQRGSAEEETHTV